MVVGPGLEDATGDAEAEAVQSPVATSCLLLQVGLPELAEC